MWQESGSSCQDCEAIRRLLSLVVDKEATAEETQAVEAHLNGCVSCGSHLAFLRAMGSALSDLSPERSSAAFYERIAQATYARPTFLDRVRQVFSPLPIRYALGTTFAVLIVGVVVVPRIMESPTGEVSSLTLATSPATTLPDLSTGTPPRVADSSTPPIGIKKPTAQPALSTRPKPVIRKPVVQVVAAGVPMVRSRTLAPQQRASTVATSASHKPVVTLAVAPKNETGPVLMARHRAVPLISHRPVLSEPVKVASSEPTVTVTPVQPEEAIKRPVAVAHVDVAETPESVAVDPGLSTAVHTAETNSARMVTVAKFSLADSGTARPTGSQRLNIDVRRVAQVPGASGWALVSAPAKF